MKNKSRQTLTDRSETESEISKNLHRILGKYFRNNKRKKLRGRNKTYSRCERRLYVDRIDGNLIGKLTFTH